MFWTRCLALGDVLASMSRLLCPAVPIPAGVPAPVSHAARPLWCPGSPVPQLCPRQCSGSHVPQCLSPTVSRLPCPTAPVPAGVLAPMSCSVRPRRCPGSRVLQPPSLPVSRLQRPPAPRPLPAAAPGPKRCSPADAVPDLRSRCLSLQLPPVLLSLLKGEAGAGVLGVMWGSGAALLVLGLTEPEQ